MRFFQIFNREEKRSMIIYIIGMMFYKFGLESFNGSIVTLATNRYDDEKSSSHTFQRIGLLTGLNQLFQCFGSIVISLMIKSCSTKRILCLSIFLFAILTSLLMIIDGWTGGSMKLVHWKNSSFDQIRNENEFYGNYSNHWILPIYCFTGIFYGMIELIRRIIPQDLIGNDLEKLQRMNSLVHLFYEISGTSGSLLTGFILIPFFGNNYSFIFTPFCFTISALIWICLKFNRSDHHHHRHRHRHENRNGNGNELEKDSNPKENPSMFNLIFHQMKKFVQSIYFGGKFIFGSRQHLWLWTGYSLSLYLHRYLENSVAPQIAKRYFHHTEWSQIILSGSNFGEFLGALIIFFSSTRIRTPIPWLRLDSIFLLILWYIPYYSPPINEMKYLWIIVLTFIPISFGWAAGDISLQAFIQSSLDHSHTHIHRDISLLGSVMSFLYSSYILLYAILNPLLGYFIDQIYTRTSNIRLAFFYTIPVQFTLLSFIVFLSTFIPRGSFAFNPTLHLSDEEELSNPMKSSSFKRENDEEHSQIKTHL